jgi:hypothetical protein
MNAVDGQALPDCCKTSYWQPNRDWPTKVDQELGPREFYPGQVLGFAILQIDDNVLCRSELLTG